MTKKAVLDLLIPRMRQHAFRRSDSLFFKQTGGIESMFSVAFATYGDVGRARPAVCVGVQAIQEVLRYQNGLFYGAPSHVPSLTLGLPNEYEYRPHNIESLRECAQRLYDDFCSVGLPFFERYCSVAEVDAAINSASGPFPPSKGNVSLNCCNGVAAAYFNRSADFEALVERYRPLVQTQAKGFYVQAFDGVVEKLRSTAQQCIQADAASPRRLT